MQNWRNAIHARLTRMIAPRRIDHATPLAELRKIHEGMFAGFGPTPHGVKAEKAQLGQIKGEWIRVSESHPNRLVLYLHGGGFIAISLPWWVAIAAVIGIGAVSGSRFANTEPRTLLRYLSPAFGSFAVALSVASLFVLLLNALQSVPIADAVVAFAPGAQETMMVLALALHLDPVFVGALHISRFLLVSLSLPILAGRLQRMPPEKTAEQVQPPVRPTIED